MHRILLAAAATFAFTIGASTSSTAVEALHSQSGSSNVDKHCEQILAEPSKYSSTDVKYCKAKHHSE